MQFVFIFFFVIGTALSAAQWRVALEAMTTKDFAHKYVKSADRQDFIEYYHQLMAREKLKKNKTKVAKRIAGLAQVGKTSLEIDHQALYATLQKKATDPKGREKLYVRYGAYQEFLKSRAQMHNALFVKARTYVKDVSTKVVNWFGTWRRGKAV